ncbi:translocation/assembly module TamB domain-containing protein [Lentiprolixibacter aurantiacus]|uniref:Translocation/assembly module TamB n=1 Tax=Lentiprolixibacter aurantiacus TaxID=2993939 RepID=A0AAE3SNQ7_9FLAO|nr:translocation/assembly module TamB [Lentiprolixibacter aurantiacus]
MQTRLARYATDTLNEDFGTNINIERLRVSLISWNTSLNNVYVEDYQKDTLFFIEELTTSVLSIRNLVNGTLEFGDIEMKGLNFKHHTYRDAEESNLDIFVAKLDDGKPRAPGTPPFLLSSSDVEITDSRFQLIDENRENSSILDFRELNIAAEDFLILGPDVSTDIQELSFKSRFGVELEKLSTNFRYTRESMRFDSLNLKTPGSELSGDLVFDYKREDLADFVNKVNITAAFSESVISLDEVNELYPQFGKGKSVEFAANLNGTLNELNVNRLFLSSDATGVRGNFTFNNLFDSSAPFRMDANIRNITTSYYQLRALMPNILGKNVPEPTKVLGRFTIRGNSVVTSNSVNAQLNLNSGLGSVYADLDLTEIDEIENAEYNGFISLIDFNLGEFVGSPNFGLTTLDFNVKGKGFARESLNTEVNGQVYSIDYNNYNYNNIQVSGLLQDQLFDGFVESNDPNVDFTFKGLADFSSAQNQFNFTAAVDYADLRKMNIIQDSVSIFKGIVNMNVVGSNLDDVAGEINFTRTSYQNANDTYFFEDFQVLSSFESDTLRTIEINSPDIITGYMRGNFKTRELGRLVQNSIGSIYTNYKPYEIAPNQEVSFNFKIYNKIVEVFFPEIQFGPNTFIRGDIVADEGDFKLTFRSPNIGAFRNELENIEVRIDNKNPLFNTFVSVDDISTVYYNLKDFNLINTTLNDTLFFRTEFKGGSEYNDSYNLNFYHTFNEDQKSVIGLKKSDISFKGNTWVINREGNAKNKVIFNSSLDSITIEEMVMNNNNREQIRLRGQLADSTYKDLELQFKLVSLNKITPAVDSLEFSGEVNGTLNVLQKDNVYLPICNLDVTDFGINGMPLGFLNVGIVGNRDLSEFDVFSQITDGVMEKFKLDGKVINEDPVPRAEFVASFSDFDLAPFSPLGEGIIENIRGKLSGTTEVKGDIRNPDMDGLLTLDDAGIAIPYLQVDYQFDDGAAIRLDKQSFDFQNVNLRDVAMNTRATLDGTISHDFFQDWRLDLDINTNNERFLILNTEFEEEVLYYGTGFVNGQGRIYGPTKALTITFDGSTAKGSSLKIPISDVASVGDYTFINFIEKDRSQSLEYERSLRDYEGLEMRFDLNVTPDAEVEIVIDQKTGSSLKGTGEGLLLIEINTNGKFNMFGDFVVVTGEYNYRFGGVIDKTFTVQPGGSIVWEGEPLEAQLNMEAVYSLNANPSPLLDNAGYTRRIPTDVVVQLTDELERPTIAFNIEFPGTSSIIKSELEYRLQDPTVEERNAFFLLAQGTFVNEGTGINSQAVTGNLIQTASGLLNQVLGGDNDKLNLGVSYEQGYQDPNNIQTENRLGVTVSTQISDRVLLNGRFGVPVGGVSETVVAGDVEVQVLLNEEGTLRAKIFNRENEIRQFLADQVGYTQGVGLSYEVDFNSFKELMKRVFGSKKPPEEEKEPEVVPEQVMGKDSLIRFVSKNRVPKSK